MWAFTTTIAVFAVLLVSASVVATTVSREALQSIRMTGPAVKRWSGYVLLAVGAWFILLAVLSDPILGS